MLEAQGSSVFSTGFQSSSLRMTNPCCRCSLWLLSGRFSWWGQWYWLQSFQEIILSNWKYCGFFFLHVLMFPKFSTTDRNYLKEIYIKKILLYLKLHGPEWGGHRVNAPFVVLVVEKYLGESDSWNTGKKKIKPLRWTIEKKKKESSALDFAWPSWGY